MKRTLIVILLLVSFTLRAQDSLQTFALEEVVVTGQFEPQSLRQSVYQVRTINAEMIDARSATTIRDVLNTELGIHFSNDLVLGTSDISIMGMSGQNVKILLDGVPLVDRDATRESLSQIDMNMVERVEIVEGPLSVVYGSDALAGVINIITRKGGRKENTLGVRVRIQEESAGTAYKPFHGEGTHNENVAVDWQGSYWYAGGGITRNTFGGLRGHSVGRQREWLPKEQWLGNGMVGFARNRVNVWYRLNIVDESLSSPGAANANTGFATDQEYITRRFTHQFHTDWDISDRWTFNSVASFQDYSRRTMTTLFNVNSGERFLSPDPGSQDRSAFTSTTFRGTFLHRVSDNVSLQPGIDINWNEGAGDRMDKRRSIGDYAAFISAEIKPVHFLTIRPGVRMIYNTVYDAPPLIPSLNVKARLSPVLDLRAAYARGFRAPALRELYFYFFDSSHSIVGNPNLEAEYSDSFSLSLSSHTKAPDTFLETTTLGLFYNRFDNMIALGVSPDNSGINTYINVAKYKTTGATLTQSFTHNQLNASVGIAAIGVYNELSGEAPSLPELMWTPEVNTSVAYRFPKAGTKLSGYYKFTGKRSVYEYTEDDSYHLASREAFHWVDIMAQQRIARYLDLTVGVRNLLNVTRLQNTSMDTSGAHSTGGPVPMSFGRSFVVALNFQLN